MKKNYIVLFVFLILFLISLKGFSQSIIKNIPVQTHIEGLTIYPNPVANGKVFVYVSTKKTYLKK